MPYCPVALKKVPEVFICFVNSIDFEPAYNLLIHLVLTSTSPATLLPQVITNLSTPPSFAQGPSIAIAILSTIFNIIPEYPAIQFQVFKTILSISRENNLYDYISQYFKSVNQWLKEWNATEEEQSQIWATIISMAEKAEDRLYSMRMIAHSSELYNQLLSALSVTSSSDATGLVMKAIRTSISLPQIFDFQKLISLPSVQQFQNDKNPAYDFLQIYLTGDLQSYRAFIKSHPTWLRDNRTYPTLKIILTVFLEIDESKAERKIRLLTLATLSNTPSRTLSYAKIASSLEIPNEDVELWLIDVIRAGLVEGKLSQARQELLVHRSTYRTFGKKEWEELGSRLEDWKVALEQVLASEQIAVLREQEQPTTLAVNGTSAGHHVPT